MVEDRIELLSLDEKGIDETKIYNKRQWLERFKQYREKRTRQILDN